MKTTGLCAHYDAASRSIKLRPAQYERKSFSGGGVSTKAVTTKPPKVIARPGFVFPPPGQPDPNSIAWLKYWAGTANFKSALTCVGNKVRRHERKLVGTALRQFIAFELKQELKGLLGLP